MSEYIQQCPFCGGPGKLRSKESRGYSDPSDRVVVCCVCDARGSVIECLNFNDWTRHDVYAFREDKELYNREHDEWKAYEARCEALAIATWNVALRLATIKELQRRSDGDTTTAS